MAEIHTLPSRIGPDGAHRLLAALQDEIASGRDLGPRGAQMRVLGHSLEAASLKLRQQVEEIQLESSTDDPEVDAVKADVLRWCHDLKDLADAFAKLGAAARAYPV